MDRFYLYDTQEDPPVLLRKNAPWPRADGGPIAGLAPGLKYLLLMPRDPEPHYDPLTERLEPTEAPDFENGQVVLGWQVVTLPAQEITRRVAAKIQEDTDAAYASLDPEVQVRYSGVYVAVKDFLSRGEIDIARGIVEQTAVPDELEDTKDSFLDLLTP